MTKLEVQLEQLKKAIARLEDVLKQEKNEYIRDSAIQRFEFTFDLSWKVVKTFLEEVHGVLCNSPKECFRQAYKEKLIDYDDYWIQMTDMRNATVHTYREEEAEKIYKKLPQTLEKFRQLMRRLESPEN